MIYGKRVLLIIGGGVAAYKSLSVIRRLTERGAHVRCVLTKGAEQFITPLSAGALSGDKVYRDLFDLTDEAEMGHIELSRSADLIVVAPATADLMAKMACGLADDLASTLLLATDAPVMIAPAMNVRMWLHPATQDNLKTLRRRGVSVVGPEEGGMACGEYGPGRMSEPEDIAKAVMGAFFRRADATRLKGARIVITSGPTHEPIDAVRYIANRSSGKQGIAIARALAKRGAQVVLISGPTREEWPDGVDVRPVETAQEMLSETMAALPADAAICAAAVADYRVDGVARQKLKKREGEEGRTLNLVENPDILATVAGLPEGRRPRLVVGFAAETDDVLDYAREKRRRKGCDWIVANDVSPRADVFGGDENMVTLVTREGEDSWPRMGKSEVAERLADRIAAALGRSRAPRRTARTHAAE